MLPGTLDRREALGELFYHRSEKTFSGGMARSAIFGNIGAPRAGIDMHRYPQWFFGCTAALVFRVMRQLWVAPWLSHRQKQSINVLRRLNFFQLDTPTAGFVLFLARYPELGIEREDRLLLLVVSG